MSFNIQSPSQQVAENLKELIFRGEWQDELPGTPALSKQTGVDRKTITAAIKLLEEQGIIQSQGTGRRRKIALTTQQRGRGQRIHILLYEEHDRHKLFIHKLYERLSALGHRVSLSSRTLSDMNMELGKVIRYVNANPAEIWIPHGGSKEILEWFSKQTFDFIALFGRRRDLPIASVGPNKTAAIIEVTEKLIS